MHLGTVTPLETPAARGPVRVSPATASGLTGTAGFFGVLAAATAAAMTRPEQISEPVANRRALDAPLAVTLFLRGFEPIGGYTLDRFCTLNSFCQRNG